MMMFFFSVMFYEKRSTDMKENFPPIGSTKKLRKKWRQKIATTQKNHEDEKSKKHKRKKATNKKTNKF